MMENFEDVKKYIRELKVKAEEADMNLFTYATKVFLTGNGQDLCLAPNGFSAVDRKGKDRRKAVLVLGMNPAGDEQTAENEKGKPHFKYIPDCKMKDCEHLYYPSFFKPIYDVFDQVTDSNVKWDWCNEQDIGSLINGIGIDEKYVDEINKYYEDNKNKECTLYFGDFFYYHETSQSEFVKKIPQKDRQEYLLNMLKMFICEIEENGNNDLKLIYIDNALASKLLFEAINRSKDFSSSCEFEFNRKKYKIFFGSMLSGQRAMDVFSRDRLIKEMQNAFKT